MLCFHQQPCWQGLLRLLLASTRIRLSKKMATHLVRSVSPTHSAYELTHIAVVMNPVLDPDVYFPNGIRSKHVAWNMTECSSTSLLSQAFQDQPISVSGHKLFRLYIVCDGYPWDIMISTNYSARTITVGTLLCCMEKDMRRQVTDEEKRYVHQFVFSSRLVAIRTECLQLNRYIRKRFEKSLLDPKTIEERMRSIVIRRDIFEPNLRFGGLQYLNKVVRLDRKSEDRVPVFKLLTIRPSAR